ncbi:MAG: outer membrane protein assembly factor [Bacteroidales bacterium]|nr:outer membrane protein assembly factor [Bacteroidales bacterium]
MAHPSPRIPSIVAALITSILSLAQEAAPPDTTSRPCLPIRAAEGLINVAETVLDALTIERQNWTLALYPAGSYSGRSGLALGLMPMLELRSDRLPRPATITPAILVSTKRMFEVQCDVDLFFNHRLDMTAKFEASRQPDDLYTIGNQKDKHSIARYDFNRQMLTAELLKGIGESSPWRIGISADFDRYDFSDIEPDEGLDIVALPLAQSGEGAHLGFGVTVGIDSRDDTLWPRGGSYVRLKALGYAKLSGMAGPFGSATLDARRYIGIAKDRMVLALQAFADYRWGDAPFPKLATCGGTRLGRAIGHNLKYIDNAAWLAQVELRAPLFWRLGATAFGAAGNVSHGWDGIADNVHLMGGLGLRLAVFEGKGLNLRLDGGVSNRGDKAIYFNIREGF